MFRRLLLLLFLFLPMSCIAAPSSDLWPYWQPHDPDSTAVVDHTQWQSILNDYVVAEKDGVNRVRYHALASSRDLDSLRDYLSELSMLDPRGLNRSEQFAYWTNLYNALTVELVTRHPKKKSILRMRERFFSIGPWNDVAIEINGVELTLNDIEHRILRPIWADHRIHYAVNCASIGCPNLNKVAFTGANVEQLLGESERDYLGHARGVKTKDGRVHLSSIFKWYREDFASTERELLTYIATFRSDIADLLKNGDVKVKYGYDWSLNSAL